MSVAQLVIDKISNYHYKMSYRADTSFGMSTGSEIIRFMDDCIDAIMRYTNVSKICGNTIELEVCRDTN